MKLLIHNVRPLPSLLQNGQFGSLDISICCVSALSLLIHVEVQHILYMCVSDNYGPINVMPHYPKAGYSRVRWS